MVADTSSLAGHLVRRMDSAQCSFRARVSSALRADRSQALAVLRKAVDAGVNHIDTAQFYGPNVANELIHEALIPILRI